MTALRASSPTVPSHGFLESSGCQWECSGNEPSSAQPAHSWELVKVWDTWLGSVGKSRHEVMFHSLEAQIPFSKVVSILSLLASPMNSTSKGSMWLLCPSVCHKWVCFNFHAVLQWSSDSMRETLFFNGLMKFYQQSYQIQTRNCSLCPTAVDVVCNNVPGIWNSQDLLSA